MVGGVKYLTYLFVGGACFWLGLAHNIPTTQEARHIDLPIQPAQNLIACDRKGLDEFYRVCRARKKSI